MEYIFGVYITAMEQYDITKDWIQRLRVFLLRDYDLVLITADAQTYRMGNEIDWAAVQEHMPYTISVMIQLVKGIRLGCGGCFTGPGLLFELP